MSTIPPQPPDHRAWTRVTPKHTVFVSTLDYDLRIARGGALNISGGGIGCYLYGPALLPGSNVLARLNLHRHPRTLKIYSRVAWATKLKDEQAIRYGLAWYEGSDIEEFREAIPSLT